MPSASAVADTAVQDAEQDTDANVADRHGWVVFLGRHTGPPGLRREPESALDTERGQTSGMRITVHHLNYSRSLRALWLLEELEIDYTIQEWRRDAHFRAPMEARRVHPLGRFPMVEIDGHVLAESGLPRRTFVLRRPRRRRDQPRRVLRRPIAAPRGSAPWGSRAGAARARWGTRRCRPGCSGRRRATARPARPPSARGSRDSAAPRRRSPGARTRRGSAGGTRSDRGRTGARGTAPCLVAASCVSR